MPRDTLTRDQIVRAAVSVLDAEGVDGLNMRRLGAQLGAAATAMYWHVKSKDELVVLAADQVWDEIELPDPAEVGWREAAAALAAGAHDMLGRHFWMLPAMSTHLIHGPNKARYDDRCLAVYETAGFSGPDADQAAATVLMFVIGAAQGEAAELAWRARLRRAGADEEQRLRDTIARISEIAEQFPRLRARATPSVEAAHSLPDEDSFEFGLRTILDGLEARLANGSTRSRPESPAGR
ncbi:TetR/AcrR family transcriptional regulator [Nonomuraea angiospora]|uniref:TetR/AcrR family transcriptional regulator n=1 Tax=Nonomuraea angiospora TaxID=46172 RepID=UPI0029B41CEA|nr:TetR/AcrR family transcriptional regulator [Nonomuraea angiospora]MDX3108016.1 TetR/AcrR family transcriptional regulator [Nonomuraea angiospora]